MSPGIHLVHKPVGPTSFAFMREQVGVSAKTSGKQPKVCHGGALDPFASGLLLILVEPATRLFDYLHDTPKVYEATVRWGVETDNGDPTGRAVFQGRPTVPNTPERLEGVLRCFLGWREQVPPATSNKRVGGERAYVKAHRGEAVDLPPTRVYLHEAQWIRHDLPGESRLRVVVRGGYYVRALARDLGRFLGCGAHLGALHRSAIGPWNDPGPGGHAEVHGREILPWTATRILNDQEVGELRQERPIPIGELSPPDWPLPDGFVANELPIRGFHLGRFAFLLRRMNNQLSVLAPLPGVM
jgi:tRNA pseudouridine55 synthase